MNFWKQNSGILCPCCEPLVKNPQTLLQRILDRGGGADLNLGYSPTIRRSIGEVLLFRGLRMAQILFDFNA